MTAGSGTTDNRQLAERVAILLAALVMLAFFFASEIPQDIPLYHHYADLLLHSPGGDRLPVEYPALSAVVFAAPLALPLPYTLGFSLLMATALAALAGCAFALGCDLTWFRRTLWYLFLGTISILFGRYDLVPALATFLAVRLAQRRRWAGAWLAALVGGALKIFPFLLLPGFLLAEWRQSGRLPWKRVAASAAGLGAYLALQDLLVPGSVLTPLRFEVNRGFELSSLPASLTALLDPVHLRWHYGFGTWELAGSHHGAILAFVALAEVAALVALWLLVWRGRLTVEAVSLAVLTVAVLSDRAFAPQYLIWLAPLWALWPTRRSWLIAAGLTTLTYPVGVGLAHALHLSLLLPTLVAAARNVVLLSGSVAWLLERLRLEEEPAAVLTAGWEGPGEQDALLALRHPIEGGRTFVLDER